MTTYVLTPAYGRDYTSKAEVEAALARGEDFLLQATPHGPVRTAPVSPRDLVEIAGHGFVNVRYGNLKRVYVTRTGRLPAPSTGEPALSFRDWLSDLDGEVFRRTGLGYEDFPDRDYHGAWSAGNGARDAAINLLADEGWEE